MNFLAHLFLADRTDDARIGSILADFTAGRIEDLREKYGAAITRSIQQHRAIDRFTDTHPTVQHSMACLEPEHGIFSGIIVDVAYDHFLLKHWPHFTDEPVEAFIDATHAALRRVDGRFPPRFQSAVPWIIQSQLLLSYRTLDGVSLALTRMSYRFTRKTTLHLAGRSLQRCYQVLDADFLTFFPELIAFVHQSPTVVL